MRAKGLKERPTIRIIVVELCYRLRSVQKLPNMGNLAYVYTYSVVLYSTLNDSLSCASDSS